MSMHYFRDIRIFVVENRLSFDLEYKFNQEPVWEIMKKKLLGCALIS